MENENEIKIDHQVAELSSLMLVQCLHISNLQEEATEVVSAVETRRLHPLIVPVSKIISILGSHINEEMKTHEVLRKIVEVDHTEIEGKLIIKLTIPVLEEEKYTLYKPHIIPKRKNDTYEAYKIDTEYIAWNKRSGETIELKDTDITECRNIKEKLQACQHNQPILPVMNSHCVSNLLTSNFENTKLCKAVETEPINLMMRLHNHNTWLYSLNRNMRTIIQCKNVTETVTLVNTGTLSFKTRCRIITEEFTIEVAGYPEVVKVEQPEVQTDTNQDIRLNFELDIRKAEKVNNISKIKVGDSKDFYKEILGEAKKIEIVKERTREIQKSNQNIKNNIVKANTITGASIVVIIIIACVVIWRCKKINPNKVVVSTINPTVCQSREIINQVQLQTDKTQEISGIRVI